MSGAFVTWFGEEGALEIEGGGNYRVYDRNDKLVEEVSGSYDQSDHIANFWSASVTTIRTRCMPTSKSATRAPCSAI